MKNIFLLFAFLSAVSSAFGQHSDTTFLSVSQENAPLEKTRFIDQYDYVFGTKQPTTWLLKLNVAPVLLPLGAYGLNDDPSLYRNISQDVNNTSKAELALEWKVAQALSVQGAGLLATRGSNYFKGHYRGSGWRLEPRWYYDMPRRIRSGQSANNVSGNYISVEYQSFAQRDQDQEPAVNFERSRFQAASLRYGLQRRILRYGFIDLSIGAGYQRSSYTYTSEYDITPTEERGIFVETRVAAGFALGAPRTPKREVAYCDVLRCFQEDRHLLKLSLAKALQIDHLGLAVHPKASYEQKMGSSAFSIETEVEFFFNTYDGFNHGLKVDKIGAGINVQPRWYFLQKHRVARGKSGNNLSGLFAGIIGGYQRSQSPKRMYYTPDAEDIFYLAPHVGIQQRLFRNGFVQYKFGLLYSEFFAGYYQGIPDPTAFLSDLQVGFVF